MKLLGILASVATPFDHTGAMYRAKIQHNVEKWSRTALTGLVAGSLAGEGPLLDADEKTELVRLMAPHVPDGRVLMADVSTEGVRTAAALARAAAGAGAHGVLSLVPHQYRNMMYGPAA